MLPSLNVIGAIILSIGFYAVIWAKAKEELREEYCCGSLGSSSDGKTPLLDSCKGEGSSLPPVLQCTGAVASVTRVQFWPHVRIAAAPVPNPCSQYTTYRSDCWNPLSHPQKNRSQKTSHAPPRAGETNDFPASSTSRHRVLDAPFISPPPREKSSAPYLPSDKIWYFLMDKNAQGVFSPQSQNNYNCGFHATCPLLDLRTKSIVVAMPPRALSYIKTSHSENEI
uniref:WAT1-related protein n=1 Tax=Fagus sylvatica TaxID=28930 RepID=A0A2N9H445_FAGSY